MKTNFRHLRDEELLLVTGGVVLPNKGDLKPKPATNASKSASPGGLAMKVLKEMVTGATIEAGVHAAKAVGQAIKNHKFQENPTPVANRNHRWLN